MSDAQVVIVGGGITGLSIARSLTNRGLTDVVVLERDALAGGGTGRSSGVVRCHYGVPSLAAMAWKSLPFFEEAGESVGFRQVGYVVAVGAVNELALRENTAMHQRLGIDVDIASPELFERLWPYARLDDYAAFSYEPRGGYGDASQTALAFGAQARAAGVRLRQGSPVTGITTVGEKVAGVRLPDGSTLSAPVVVLAAGVWSAPLLTPLTIDFPVRAVRTEVVLVDAGQPVRPVPVLSDLVSLQYVRAEGSDQFLVGTSDHSEPEYADPDNYSNRASAIGLERAAAKIVHRFPKLAEASVAGSYAGCYDATPDYNPVICPVGPSGLFLAAGFSGHGFKISPAVGELTADLILDGDSRDPSIRATDFRLDRFAEGSLLRSAHTYVGAAEMR